MFIRLIRKTKDRVKDALFQYDSPWRIAGGAALGIFIGIVPSFFIGLFAAAFLARIMKLNMLATVLGTSIINPLTAPLFIAGSFFLGAIVTGESVALPEGFNGMKLLSSFGETAKIYLIGNIILATAFSLMGLIAVYVAVRMVRH